METSINWSKVMELKGTEEHTIVSFVRKRISCRCLDEKYNQVKSIKKLGICMNAQCSQGKTVERRKMFNCTRCRRENYCSRVCQRAAWPEHKKVCGREMSIGRNNACEYEALYFKAKICVSAVIVLSLLMVVTIVSIVSSARFEACANEALELRECGTPSEGRYGYGAIVVKEWGKLSKASQDAFKCAYEDTPVFLEYLLTAQHVKLRAWSALS